MTSKVAVDANKYPVTASGMEVNIADTDEDYLACGYCATFDSYVQAMDKLDLLQDSLVAEMESVRTMAASALTMCEAILSERGRSGDALSLESGEGQYC